MGNRSEGFRDSRWSRRWTAKLGLALFLPFPICFGVFEIGRNIPNAPTWLEWSLLLEIPLSVVSGTGVLLLLAAWITPKRKPDPTG